MMGGRRDEGIYGVAKSSSNSQLIIKRNVSPIHFHSQKYIFGLLVISRTAPGLGSATRYPAEDKPGGI